MIGWQTKEHINSGQDLRGSMIWNQDDWLSSLSDTELLPILSSKLLNECLLISWMLSLRAMAKSASAHRWPHLSSHCCGRQRRRVWVSWTSGLGWRQDQLEGSVSRDETGNLSLEGREMWSVSMCQRKLFPTRQSTSLWWTWKSLTSDFGCIFLHDIYWLFTSITTTHTATRFIGSSCYFIDGIWCGHLCRDSSISASDGFMPPHQSIAKCAKCRGSITKPGLAWGRPQYGVSNVSGSETSNAWSNS